VKESFAFEGENVEVTVRYLQSVRRALHNHKTRIDFLLAKNAKLEIENAKLQAQLEDEAAA
jgi:regulator of replication initiation timing